MIYSYSITEQQLDTNEALVYDVDQVKTCCTGTHTPGTPTFTLVDPGYYEITVTACGAPAATGTDPVVLSCYNGTNTIPSATASALSDGEVNLVINTVITVRPSCCLVDNSVALRVVNTGVPANYTNTTISISKRK